MKYKMKLIPGDFQSNMANYFCRYVFAVIYTFEVLVKVLAKGFILHPFSYLRNSWNWLDFFVVIVGYVSYFTQFEIYLLQSYIR